MRLALSLEVCMNKFTKIKVYEDKMACKTKMNPDIMGVNKDE